MKKQTQKIVVLVILLLTPYLYVPIFGQVSEAEVLDSLRGMSYDKLKSSFDENTHNKAIAGLYANAYLRKAKRDRDTFRIADGYLFFVNIQMDKKQALEYTDSIILVTKANEKFMLSFGVGLFEKGKVLQTLFKNKIALDYFIKANRIFTIRDNKMQQLRVRHSIGLLKNTIDNEEEALIIFRENYNYLSQDSVKNLHRTKYLISLLALSDSYNRNQKPDSAELYSERGIIETFKLEDKQLYSHFLLAFGISKSLKGERKLALDSILKSTKLFESRVSVVCDAYLIISGIYEKLNNDEQAILYLKKIDSIYNEHKEVYGQTSSAHKRLLKFYQKDSLVKLQIETINKIIFLDSIFESNNKDLNKQIVKEYEIPILISEKQRLIDSLNKSKIVLSYKLKWFLSLLILAVLLMSFFFYRQRLYKSNFETISVKLEENQILINKKLMRKQSKDLSKEQVEIIMQRIDNFEKELGFLEKNISLQILSTRLKTNTTYLSKVFNQHKKQKLADYLNELRINYVLEVLPKDKKLQQYTIKALASEFGYNTAESFSKAFFRRTEVYPSFYIKELNKDKNINT